MAPKRSKAGKTLGDADKVVYREKVITLHVFINEENIPSMQSKELGKYKRTNPKTIGNNKAFTGNSPIHLKNRTLILTQILSHNKVQEVPPQLLIGVPITLTPQQDKGSEMSLMDTDGRVLNTIWQVRYSLRSSDRHVGSPAMSLALCSVMGTRCIIDALCPEETANSVGIIMIQYNCRSQGMYITATKGNGTETKMSKFALVSFRSFHREII